MTNNKRNRHQLVNFYFYNPDGKIVSSLAKGTCLRGGAVTLKIRLTGLTTNHRTHWGSIFFLRAKIIPENFGAS